MIPERRFSERFGEVHKRNAADLNRYAMDELQKDVDAELQKLPEHEREKNRPEFAIFVVHNKLKKKVGVLPATIRSVFEKVPIKRKLILNSQILCRRGSPGSMVSLTPLSFI